MQHSYLIFVRTRLPKALNLLSMGLSVEQIAKATDLSAEDIQNIQTKKE